MTLRAGHGSGAGVPRIELLPVDELPPLNAQDTATGAALANARGKPFERGNAAAKNRRPALASIGGMPADALDPLYKTALGWARRYRRRRVSELARDHGGNLSSGVCAMVASSALDMAGSRYLVAKAAATGDASLLLAASKLATSSRQQEICALELAAREAESRRTTGFDPHAALAAAIAADRAALK